MKIYLALGLLLMVLLLTVSACAPITPVPEAAASVATSEPQAEASSLTGVIWQWVSLADPMAITEIPTPESYTLAFQDDGTVAIQADCNSASGTYTTTDSSQISIAVGPMTRMACPPESLSDRFVTLLGAAALYFFQDGDLYMDTFADSGTLRFTAAVAAAPANSLANLAYTGIIDDQAVTLVDGVASIEEPGSGTPAVRLVESATAYGDLDGDGVEDAVVMLEYNSSGSGRFAYLAPVLSVATAPEAGPALMVGDRIQIKSLAIEDGIVVMNSIEQGEGDAACCASTQMQRPFALENGALVETGSDVLGKISLEDLNGTNWVLVDLAGGQEAPLPDTRITLNAADANWSGSTGCNDYSAVVTPVEGAPQSVTVGPIDATRKVCADAVTSQEGLYLDRLAKVVGWWYDGGKLMLSYASDDNVFSQLVYDAVQ